MDSFDKFLRPLILCPWGCTEYYHHCCGYIGFDLILQQHFQHLDIPLISVKGKFSKTSSSRLDFLRDAVEDYECLLMNPEWRPLPSIVWMANHGPAFATCQNHDRGTDRQYFHLPRFPEYGVVPASHPDQLCHAVLKPCTLRPDSPCGMQLWGQVPQSTSFAKQDYQYSASLVFTGHAEHDSRNLACHSQFTQVYSTVEW